MILDIENNGYSLHISYFDSEGKVKIKKFPISNPQNWTLCSASDPKRSLEISNWDGKSVKKVQEKGLNKWSIYEFIDNLPPEDRDEITALNFPKVQSVDIETEVIDSFPDPLVARERITTIAISTENNSTIVLGWKPIDRQQEKAIFDQHRAYLKDHGDWQFKYICFEDEYNMMFTFINRFLPNFSLMIGWNFLNFDWKYIFNRCSKLGIDPSMASPSKKLQGKENFPMHIGIVDYLDIYRRWDRTVAIKENNTLDFVSNAVLGVTKLKYAGTLQDLYEKDYDKYILYNAIDSALVCLIHKKLRTLDSVFSVSNLCNLSIYKASSAVNLTEALLWKGYYSRKRVIADRRIDIQKGAYEGAYVKEPEKGIFRAVTCFDYASLYPSIMRQYNISPESFVMKSTNESKTEEYRNNKDYIASVTGAIYDNREVSVLKEILTDLYTKRKHYKSRHLEIERLLAKK
jgi:DNA polymerase elongation subunit (family B)